MCWLYTDACDKSAHCPQPGIRPAGYAESPACSTAPVSASIRSSVGPCTGAAESACAAALGGPTVLPAPSASSAAASRTRSPRCTTQTLPFGALLTPAERRRLSTPIAARCQAYYLLESLNADSDVAS